MTANPETASSRDVARDAVFTPRAVVMVALMTFAVAVCWAFPRLWYTRTEPQQGYRWLIEQERIDGWSYTSQPVAKAAEAVLVADQLVNGEFTNSAGRAVRVFSAKRFREKQHEVGLFVHTPDRCWTQAGWSIDAVAPDFLEVTVHGMRLQFERRVFAYGQQRELVYFGGMVGGQPLPYRLDHNMAVGMRYQLRQAKDPTGSTLRASDARFWQRVWDSFAARRPLLGPKQFIRISTPLDNGDDLDAADRLLREMLPLWLSSGPYEPPKSA